MTNTATPASIHRNVVPSEVGWQFVPQYYTFVNKQPDRLHCFYTKKSTFIHGTEGEDVNPCHGQQVRATIVPHIPLNLIILTLLLGNSREDHLYRLPGL